MRMLATSSGGGRGGAELVAVRRGVACGSARRWGVMVSEFDGSRTQPARHGVVWRFDPNLCKDVWSTLCAQIEKCSQVFSESHSSR